MKKGSSCVEALDEISHKVAGFFGGPDRSRKHKEKKFHQDLRMLVEHLQKNAVHTVKGGREVMPPGPPGKSKGAVAKRRGVVDIMVLGHDALNAGKVQ